MIEGQVEPSKSTLAPNRLTIRAEVVRPKRSQSSKKLFPRHPDQEPKREIPTLVDSLVSTSSFHLVPSRSKYREELLTVSD
jgi:hypothetical protein